MRLAHFLRLSLDYRRTHQLLLRVLLDDVHFANLLTELPKTYHYTVRLEAEAGLYDLGLYHNGSAICYLQTSNNELLILSADNSSHRRWAYNDLIPLLNCYLDMCNNSLSHQTTVVLAQYYRDALQQKYRLTKMPAYL